MESDAGCSVGTLIDLSEPVPSGTDANPEENKENSVPVTEAREVTRKSSQTDCRLDIQDSLKQDIVDKHDSGSQPQSSLSLSDVALIEDEVFDFDLPVSPESAAVKEREEKAAKANNNDEEEVFFGPMGFTEKCIAAGVAEEAFQPLSPLRPDQMAELAKEAYSVACRIAMMRSTSHSSGSSVTTSPPTSTTTTCRRKLIGEDSAGDREAGSRSEAETGSPRKRQRSETFSKDSAPSRTEKRHHRTSTFTKEEGVDSVGPSSGEPSTVGPSSGEPSSVRPSSVGPSSVEPSSVRPSSVAPSSMRPSSVEPSSVSCSGEKEKQQRRGVGGGASQGRVSGSRLQPPSKLRRYNNSQPSLARPKAVVAEEGGERQEGGNEATTTTIPGATRKSLQLPRAGGAVNSLREHRSCRDDGGDSDPTEQRPAQNTAPRPRVGVRRTQSLTLKSGLPSGRASKLALPTKKSTAATASGQRTGVQSHGDSGVGSGAGRKTSGIPKGPATKPQLMQPGQLQRKAFAAGRSKNTSAVVASGPGPLKASAPHVKPNFGDTVERPYNPALAAAAGGNSQCPQTPATQKAVVPRVLSVSSDVSSPAKSSCSSSSVCGSTPGSVKKRLSLLPMCAKRRSGASALPPPSPLSVGSSSSSVSKRSLASSSDAADSPVFDSRPSSRLAKGRQTSGVKESCTSSDLDGPGASPFAFKPRKALVQNTPDLPKRSLSRWSPVRKPQAMPLEDQVSRCTKRVTPPDHRL